MNANTHYAGSMTPVPNFLKLIKQNYFFETITVSLIKHCVTKHDIPVLTFKIASTNINGRSTATGPWAQTPI